MEDIVKVTVEEFTKAQLDQLHAEGKLVEGGGPRLPSSLGFPRRAHGRCPHLRPDGACGAKLGIRPHPAARAAG